MAIDAQEWRMVPHYHNASGESADAAYTNTGGTLTGTNVRLAYVFQAPKSGTIQKVIIRQSTNTTPQSIRVSIQDCDSDYTPDGTDDVFVDISSGSLAANTIHTVEPTSTGAGGGSRKTVNKGDFIAIVIKWVSTTGSFAFSQWPSVTSFTQPIAQFVHSRNFTSSWQTIATSTVPTFAIEYTDGDRPQLPTLGPYSSNTTIGLTTASNPDEVGNVFVAPYTMEVGGFWVVRDAFTAGNTATLRLYDANDNVLLSSTEKSVTGINSGGGRCGTMATSSVIIQAGQTYRVTAKTAGATYTVHELLFGSTDNLKNWPWGNTCYKTRRQSSGAWTDTNTSRIPIGLVVRGYDSSVVSSLKIR